MLMGGGYKMFLVVSAGFALALGFSGGECWALTHALGVFGESCWGLPSLTHVLALD